MRVPLVSTAMAAVLITASTSSAASQLYLSPSVSSPQDSTIRLDSVQANAVLAHSLGVSQYQHLPATSYSQSKQQAQDWRQLLTVDTESTRRVIVVVECPTAQACRDVVPQQFSNDDDDNKVDIELPSLSTESWLSVITLHLHRLMSSVELEQSQVYGVDKLVEAIKTVEGWTAWVGDELGSRIGWDKLKNKLKTAVEPVIDNMGMLTDVDLLDSSANTLLVEMQDMTRLTESLQSSGNNYSDDGPQGQHSTTPQLVALHLKGLKDLAQNHATSSDVYQRASTMLRQTLSATLDAIKQSSPSGDQPQFVMLTLTPYKQPWLRKRSAWLSPFESGSASYAKVVRPRLARTTTRLNKRSTVFSPRADATKTATPVVPQSRRCFESEKELNKLTADCLGRGKAVKGVTTRDLKGGECWVCSCGTTTDERGKRHKWAGEGCEKEDLSSDFVLLFFSSLGLVLILIASIVLLYGIGNVELPGTLSSVSGNSAGHKRD
ncbi:hypothetical protein OIO90_003520 [Microbotryomycetes sp. JL221]|nr:hypothetical protein OIO90_003520 [Microbotryomycetes sp. JL221]